MLPLFLEGANLERSNNYSTLLCMTSQLHHQQTAYRQCADHLAIMWGLYHSAWGLGSGHGDQILHGLRTRLPVYISQTLLYSGKIWQALNLAILMKNAIFFNLVSFIFGDSVPQPKNDITTTT